MGSMEQNYKMESVLATLPKNLHEGIKIDVEENGIIATICDKVIPVWSTEQQIEALDQIDADVGVYKEVLVDIFKVNETKRVTDSHREFIKKVFSRFKTCFDHLTEDLVEKHDMSKYW